MAWGKYFSVVVGNLANDPELKYVRDDLAVTNFTVAVNTAKDKDTEWVRCVAFGEKAAYIAKNFKKGAHVYVDGNPRTNKWEDNDGNKRYSHEILIDMFISKDYDQNSQPAKQEKPKAKAKQKPVNVDTYESDDDDLPF